MVSLVLLLYTALFKKMFILSFRAGSMYILAGLAKWENNSHRVCIQTAVKFMSILTKYSAKRSLNLLSRQDLNTRAVEISLLSIFVSVKNIYHRSCFFFIL